MNSFGYNKNSNSSTQLPNLIETSNHFSAPQPPVISKSYQLEYQLAHKVSSRRSSRASLSSQVSSRNCNFSMEGMVDHGMVDAANVTKYGSLPKIRH